MSRLGWESVKRKRLAVLDDEIVALERELQEKKDEYDRIVETTYEDVAAEEAIDRGREP